MPFFLLRSRQDLSTFMLWILVSSIVPSLYAFWDIRQGLSDMANFRLQSTFSHPNIFAFYLVLILSLALYLMSSRAVRLRPELRTLITYYIPLLIIFLALTKTRSAWAGCGFVFMVYAIRIDHRFFATLLIVPLLFVFDSSLKDRVTNLTQGPVIEDFSQLNKETRLNSYAWRQALWESAMPLIAAKPLTGYGLETFKPSTPEFFPLIGPEGIDAHNFYLQATFEMGLLGLLALVWLLGTVAARVASGYRHDPEGTVIILSTLVAYSLESYSDNMHFYLQFNWYFWFALGTICAWIEREKKYRADEA
jgi:O-antigen ligase